MLTLSSYHRQAGSYQAIRAPETAGAVESENGWRSYNVRPSDVNVGLDSPQ